MLLQNFEFISGDRIPSMKGPWGYMCHDVQSSIHITNDQRAYQIFRTVNGNSDEAQIDSAVCVGHSGFSFIWRRTCEFSHAHACNDWAQAQQHFDQFQFKSDMRHFCLLSIDVRFIKFRLCDTLKTRRDGGGHFSFPAAPASSWHAYISLSQFEWTDRAHADFDSSFPWQATGIWNDFTAGCKS
jgi:hypothetical protein